MIGFTAFKTRKPRSFDYRPRYFDPEKEAREQRRREVLGDEAHDPDKEYVPGAIIGSLRMRRGLITQGRKQSNKRVQSTRVAILVLLVLAILWYLFS